MNSECLLAVLFVEVEVEIVKSGLKAGEKALFDGSAPPAGLAEFRSEPAKSRRCRAVAGGSPKSGFIGVDGRS